MQSRRCVACGQVPALRTQLLHWVYCPHREFQRKRRRRWHCDKLAADPDYRDTHPDYADR